MQQLIPEEQTQENARLEKYRQWYAKYHPHPILVHFPIALHYFSGFMDALFLIDPSPGYDTAVFSSFLIATVMGLLTLFSGMLSWWINYGLARTKLFMIKLSGAIFTFVVGLVPLVQKYMNPHVAYSHGMDGWVYHGVIFITVVSVTIVGYYGGKLTWRKKR